MARVAPQITFTVRKTDSDALMRALDDVDRKVKWDNMKGPLRKWAQMSRKVMRGRAPKAKAEYNRYNEVRDGRAGAGFGKIAVIEPGGSLKRSIGYRIKRYRRGRIVFIAVGGQMNRPAWHPAGWRAHFPEAGAYNRWHRRRLGRTLYRTRTFDQVQAAGLAAIEQGALAAIRAAGGSI